MNEVSKGGSVMGGSNVDGWMHPEVHVIVHALLIILAALLLL